MKRSIIAVMVSLSLILAASVFAAGQSGRTDQRATGAQAQVQKIIKADDLSGKKVKDTAGNEIGDIKSIALDTSSGNAYAVIEHEDMLHPVPVSALKKMGDDYSLTIDKSRLAQAPSVTDDNLEQNLSQTNFSDQVNRFFGIAPATGPGAQRQQQQRAQAQAVIKADDLSGKKVLDSAGNDIGDIKSIALDTTSGNAYAMIELEDKLHPVPVNALKKMGDDYSLTIDKSRLAQSPSVTEDTMEQTLSQSNFSNQVHRFFGVAPPTGPGMMQQQKQPKQQQRY
jgi:sporulation protein YlmC with PRC-barrel domain